MKIVFYRHSLLSRGGDKMFLFHANRLAEAGHDVTLYCNTKESVFSINPGLHLQKIPWPGKAGTILFGLLCKFAADIVVADIIPLAVALSMRNHRVTYFAQDLDTSYYTSPLLIALMRFLLRWGMGGKNIPTLAVSATLAEELRLLTGKACKVIPNGIEQTVFYPEPSEALIAGKKGKMAVLLHARSDQRKGFDLAGQVIHNLLQKGAPPFVIWTVGEHTGDTFKDSEHRDFGYVDEQQLRQIMSSADIFLYPSRHEGFGLFPLEAMACGCAVVTTSAVPYARHGENALVAPVEDCATLEKQVFELLHDPTTCSRLRQAGKNLARQYSSAESARHFGQALAGIMKNEP